MTVVDATRHLVMLDRYRRHLSSSCLHSSFSHNLPMLGVGAKSSGTPMHPRIVGVVLLCVCFCTGGMALQAQEFKLFDRTVHVHGFVSHGFLYTIDNNCLTMNASQGSGVMTLFALYVSARLGGGLELGPL